MDYNKKNWKPNELITDEDLNNIENGIANIDTKVNNIYTKINKNYVYNVMEHGAVGDGKTIENDAIQALLDKALDNNGITLYFPKGVYRINGPLEVFSNTHLILDDNAIITRKLHGALLINGRYKGGVQYGNIHVEGGIWDLDNETSVYSGSVHFILGNADNFLIENCTFLNNHGNHALDIGGCENLTVRNCKFLGQMPDPDTSRYYVEAIQLSEFTQAGQPSWGGGWNNRACKNVLVDNCFFDKNVKNELYNHGYGCAVGNHSSYEDTGSSDITITNCHINGCEFGLRPCCWHNTVIENCFIYNCGEGIHLTSCGKSEARPDKHSPLTNTVINNCTIIDSEKYDIWARGKFAYDNPEDISHLDGVVINNCKFKGCNGTSSKGSIYLDVCNNARINNNIFENTSRAIWFTSCKNITVCNNLGENIIYEGIFVSQTTLVEEEYKPRNENLKILNNTFKNCRRTGVFIQLTDEFIVSNNTIENCAIDDDYERNGILVANTSFNGFVENNIVEGEHHDYDIKIVNANNSNVILKANHANDIYFNSLDVLYLGDSITYGTGATDRERTNYPSRISQKYGVGCTNIGVPGMRFYNTDTSKDAISVIKTKTYLNRVKTISIFLGTNDWRHGTTICDDISSTDGTTIEGAFNNLISYIREVNPTINIVVFSPIYRSNISGANATTGLTLKQFCDKLKACAEYNCVKFVDMYNTSGIGPLNASKLLSDGTHPNDLGYEVLSGRIYSELIL